MSSKIFLTLREFVELLSKGTFAAFCASPGLLRRYFFQHRRLDEIFEEDELLQTRPLPRHTDVVLLLDEVGVV